MSVIKDDRVYDFPIIEGKTELQNSLAGHGFTELTVDYELDIHSRLVTNVFIHGTYNRFLDVKRLTEILTVGQPEKPTSEVHSLAIFASRSIVSEFTVAMTLGCDFPNPDVAYRYFAEIIRKAEPLYYVNSEDLPAFFGAVRTGDQIRQSIKSWC